MTSRVSILALRGDKSTTNRLRRGMAFKMKVGPIIFKDSGHTEQ
jgi:hypothetical protein